MAGFLLQQFGAIPDVGEQVEAQGWRFEIVDLDGRRIDKALATRIDDAAADDRRDGAMPSFLTSRLRTRRAVGPEKTWTGPRSAL